MDNQKQIKKCSKCSEEKLLINFRKQKKGKFGVMSVCKICQSIIEKNNRLTGNSTSIERNKRFRENNPDKIKNWLKTYSENNKEKRKEYDKKYREENKELKNKQSRDYYLRNPHIKAWRTVLKSSLRRMGKNKEDETIVLLGYSAIELKEHLEKLFVKGMSWDNHGEWHIDHIKPVSSFDISTEIKIVNALSNLQPLWAKDNRDKWNYLNM